MGEERISPQERIKCACPEWTDARQCLETRCPSPLPSDDHEEPYGGSVYGIELCECACHAEDEEEDF